MVDLVARIPGPVLDEFVDGRWLPIIGAGLSRNAVVNDGEPPVLWSQLGASLASAVELEPNDPVLDVLSAYNHSFGRQSLIQQIGFKIRAHDANPGTVHNAFARIQFEDLITTNFDSLLEASYEKIGRRPFPVVGESLLAAKNYYPGPRIIKLHGDLAHPDHMVITEDDYDSFLVSNPLLATSVTAMLVNRTAMFIGYSLDDPDMRQMLALIKQRLGRMMRPMWTIQVGASAIQVARFERRGVHVINLPKPRGGSVGEVLQDFFEQLQQYWQDHVLTKTTPTDDRVAVELQTFARGEERTLAARLGAYRLVFFAVPLPRVRWYRENVYPVVEARGFVPVSAAEVFSPDGSTVAKVDNLLVGADLIIVEMGSEWSNYEARRAVELKGPAAVLCVTEGERFLEIGEVTVASRSNPEELAYMVERWIDESGLKPSSLNEAYRLIGVSPGLAIVSAVTVLEAALKERTSPYEKRGSTLRPTDMAFYNGLLDRSLEEPIREAVEIRNKTLHEPKSPKPSRGKAEKLVNAIDSAVGALGPSHRWLQ